MENHFNTDQIRKNLLRREVVQRDAGEQSRQIFLDRSIAALKKLFDGTGVEVFLIGSIIQPNKFYSRSDVDVVLKNFTGDRFDVWTQLEGMIERDVEIILFESCHFQEHILKEGKKVV